MQTKTSQINWPTTLFLLGVPIAAMILAPLYFIFHGFSPALIIFTMIFAAATNLSVTAGYHRLYAHKAYEAHPVARFILLLIASSGWQGPALKWASDHRRHHSFIDTEKDPYNIHRGFWYAHMGWLFRSESVDQKISAPDLQKDWMVRYQYKFYVPLAIFTGFIVPMLIGWAMGSPWGGLVIGGFLRIAMTQQSTFFVNSLCHTLGKQTYSKDISARDSFIVAILTHGEGYHNYHHKFQLDYRNGIRWYHWDPTKWVIKSLALLGLAKRLRKVPQTEILKARLEAEAAQLSSHGIWSDRMANLRERILTAQDQVKKLKEDYHQMKHDYSKRAGELHAAYDVRVTDLKREIALAKLEFQVGLKQWQVCLNYAKQKRS